MEPEFPYRTLHVDGFTKSGGQRVGALWPAAFTEQPEKLGQQSRGGLIGGNDEVRVADGSENADPEEGVDGHGVSVARTVA